MHLRAQHRLPNYYSNLHNGNVQNVTAKPAPTPQHQPTHGRQQTPPVLESVRVNLQRKLVRRLKGGRLSDTD
ncbi:unnamed protein product [Didymodactylos carnosus]|uniref:Uncharacterized protein n=1 Tax=Didymodactylos carnosus TaxID=1234261 RepID=A0A8S2RYC4_9BILA|nr:unnamed protein product [Didymodactylos carnosus]CAF4191835.1 unnamed protein product [Didymodactylos carnosus]